MPKSFDEFQSKKENYSDFKDNSVSINPNITLNAETAKEIYHKNQVIFFTSMLGRAFSTIITAPLTTLQVSLQLSVLSHQDKYGDVTEVEKNQLMKTPKEITAYEKRRYELIVKSGVTGTNKPFRAPVYLNYREAFKALQNQGILGFYKGNFLGLCHIWMTTYMKFAVSNMINFKNYMKEKEDSLAFRGMFMFASSTMIDMFFHPLQTMQSRFILQNRLPNFRTYKSVFHFLRRHVKRPGAMMQGWGVHFPKNILLSLGQVTLFQNDPFLAFVSSNIISQSLVYPLMTAMRRVQCQDKIAGMLPIRYEGVWHAVKLITAEEGIRGLFRGYAAFLPAHLFTAFTLLGLNIVGEHTYSLKEQ